MFIVQKFTGGRWIDFKRRRSFELAKGDAWWESSPTGLSPYRKLTRVIIRNEIVLQRYGQQQEKGE